MPPEVCRPKDAPGEPGWRVVSWTVVGKMMQETYGWLLAGGTRPNFVITD